MALSFKDHAQIRHLHIQDTLYTLYTFIHWLSFHPYLPGSLYPPTTSAPVDLNHRLLARL